MMAEMIFRQLNICGSVFFFLLLFLFSNSKSYINADTHGFFWLCVINLSFTIGAINIVFSDKRSKYIILYDTLWVVH